MTPEEPKTVSHAVNAALDITASREKTLNDLLADLKSRAVPHARAQSTSRSERRHFRNRTKKGRPVNVDRKD